MKSKLFKIVILLTAAFLLLSTSLFNLIDTYTLSKGVITEGEVVDIKESRCLSSRSMTTKCYSPVVKFYVNNSQEIVFISKSETPQISNEIGSKTQINYRKNNPQDAEIKSEINITRRYLLSLVLILLALSFIYKATIDLREFKEINKHLKPSQKLYKYN